VWQNIRAAVAVWAVYTLGSDHIQPFVVGTDIDAVLIAPFFDFLSAALTFLYHCRPFFVTHLLFYLAYSSHDILLLSGFDLPSE
jgi:hypothetical protein